MLRCISRYEADIAVSVLSLISSSIEKKRSDNHQPIQRSKKLKDRASFYYFFSRNSYMKSAQYEQTNPLSIRRAQLVPQECRLSVEYKSAKHTKYVVSSIQMKYVSENSLSESQCFALQNKICPSLRLGICIYVGHFVFIVSNNIW